MISKAIDPKGGGFKRNGDNPLDCDLLVVYEASMVDVMLMQALVNATPDRAALLIVGDIDHSPPSDLGRCSPTSSALALYPWCA
jgi:ATP-dependent exoDNAse (exonuclease V) alpha subunit